MADQGVVLGSLVLPLTLEEVKDQLDVNEHGIVTSPGAFYGKPAFVPAFWLRFPCTSGTDAVETRTWDCLPEFRVLWPDLSDKPGARLVCFCDGGSVDHDFDTEGLT